MKDYKQTAICICQKIISNASSSGSQKLGLNILVDHDYMGTVVKRDEKFYSLTSKPETYEGDYEYDESVYVEQLALPCCGISQTKNAVIFECIDPLEASGVKLLTVAEAAKLLSSVDFTSISKAYVRVPVTSYKSTFSLIESCEGCDMVEIDAGNSLKIAAVCSLVLDAPLELDYIPVINHLAQCESVDQRCYAESIGKLGKRFFGEDESSFRSYVIRYLTTDGSGQVSITATNVEDAVKSFNEEIAQMADNRNITEITSIECNGRKVPQSIVDEMNSSFLDECDGAAGGDAGGASAGAAGDASAGDAGDTAAEMAGTTTAEVLGKCEPGKGYMGKDNFYIPAQAKVPLHRWEIANGGSKRKKGKNGKPKKYEYEKGAKVVVSMFEDEMLNEWEDKLSTYKYLKGKTWKEVTDDMRELNYKEGKGPSYDRWEAAQLPPPEEDVHGSLGGCTIDEDIYKRRYLKEFYIHGLYKDGTMFELGPMKRKVAAEYLSIHHLSLNVKSYEQLKDTGFSSLQLFHRPNVGGTWHIKKMDTGFYVKNANDTSGSGWEGPWNKDNLADLIGKGVFTIIQLSSGFFLKAVANQTRIGPFTTKQLARTFAYAYDIALEKGSRGEQSEEGYRVEYPAFAFSYKMAGVPCMDIVVAEDLNRAMKLFDFQWRVFDNTRPIKDKFNTLQELQRDLSLLFIRDIEIEEIKPEDLDEYVELAKVTGNPSTIPELASRCRNPKFKYILGTGGKDGRIVVKFD